MLKPPNIASTGHAFGCVQINKFYKTACQQRSPFGGKEINMARFSISGYDDNGKCKICGSHVSEKHNEGCELGAVYAERKEMRLVIEQFLKLLGVETITSAFAKIAAEHSVHTDLKPPCPTCNDTGRVEYPCPNCRTSKASSSR